MKWYDLRRKGGEKKQPASQHDICQNKFKNQLSQYIFLKINIHTQEIIKNQSKKNAKLITLQGRAVGKIYSSPPHSMRQKCAASVQS